jgi:hypothetical protein
MLGFKAFIRINLSIIENASYFINASARKQRTEPYSKDNIVNFLTIKSSVKYSITFTIS